MMGRDLARVVWPVRDDVWITHAYGDELPDPVCVPAGCVAVDVGNKSPAARIAGLVDPGAPDHLVAVVKL